VIHVAWIDRRHNPLDNEGYPGGADNSRGVEPQASLYYARSLDGGRSFEKNQYVTGLVCACCQIVVNYSKGNVVLAYRSVEPGNIRDIFTTVSSDNGKTWSSPKLASRDNWILDGCPHQAPTLASTPTSLYLAWMTGVSGNAEIYMVESKDGGRTFGERLHVSAGVNGARNPRLVAFGDRVGVVFEGEIEDGKQSEPTVVFRELERGRMSPPRPIPLATESGGHPEIVADDRGLLIGWTRSSSGSSSIHLGRRD
jgi:hypothetical protein